MPRNRRRQVVEAKPPVHNNSVLKSHDLDDMLRRLSPSEIVRRVSDSRGISGPGNGAPAAALLNAVRSVQQLGKSPRFVQQWEDKGFGSAIPAESAALQQHARNVLETGWAPALMFAEAGQLAGLAAASEGQLRVSKGRGPRTGPNTYGVRQGRFRGVFAGLAWAEVEPFVRGHSAAAFKKWPTEEAARNWVSSGGGGPCRLVTPATLRAARVVAGLDSSTEGTEELLRCWDESGTAGGSSGGGGGRSSGGAAAAAAASAAASSGPAFSSSGGIAGATSAYSSADPKELLAACGDYISPGAARALRAAGTSSVGSSAAAAAPGRTVGGAAGGFDDSEEVEPPGDYTLWFDGASRSNPGPAAWGSVLRAGTGDPSGRLCFSGHGYMGQATNNEAEYTGLIRGLEMTRQLLVSGSRLLVRGDSKLALHQVLGRWQAREPRMAVLRDAALTAKRALEDGGVTVRLEHVLRDSNPEADRLASSGVDEGLSGALGVGYESGMGLPRA